MHQRLRPRLRAIFAATGAIVISTIGLTGTPAIAAPIPAISITEAPEGGGKVTLKGTGFNGDPGIYLGVGPQGLPGFYAGSGELLEGYTHYIGTGLETGNSQMGITAPMNNGSFSISIELPPEPTTGLAIYTSKAHGQGFKDPSQNTISKISYATPKPVASPKLVATQIPAGGGEITVSGSGYLADEPGLYIGVGPASAPTFYSAHDAGTIKREDVLWLSPNRAIGAGVGRLNADGTFSATFSVEAGTQDLAVFTSKAHNLGKADTSLNAKLVIGSTPAPTPEPSQTPAPKPSESPTEKPTPKPSETPITKPTDTPDPEPQPTAATKTPQLSTTKVPTNGGKITVTGSNFSTSGPGIYLGLGPAGLPGFYKASEQLIDGTTVYISRTNTDGIGAMGRTARLHADGTFRVVIDLPASSKSALALYTSLAHGQGVNDTSQDVALKLSYGQSQTGTAQPSAITKPGNTAKPSSEPPKASSSNQASSIPASPSVASSKPVYKKVCTANRVSGATLSWGVKSSFRNYIRSGVANGGWVLNGVTHTGSSFGFTSGSGSFDKTKRIGTVSFPGSIHFSGHEGTLDLKLSSIRIVATGPSTGTLYANVTSSDTDGKKTSSHNVAFASLGLSNLKVTETHVSISGAQATLSAAGANAFAGFYKAGDALDPIGFSLPLGQQTGCSQVLVSAGTGIYAGTGTVGVPLAATGNESAIVLSIGGALLLASGASLLMLRRPRRVRAH